MNATARPANLLLKLLGLVAILAASVPLGAAMSHLVLDAELAHRFFPQPTGLRVFATALGALLVWSSPVFLALAILSARRLLIPLRSTGFLVLAGVLMVMILPLMLCLATGVTRDVLWQLGQA